MKKITILSILFFYAGLWQRTVVSASEVVAIKAFIETMECPFSTTKTPPRADSSCRLTTTSQEPIQLDVAAGMARQRFDLVQNGFQYMGTIIVVKNPPDTATPQTRYNLVISFELRSVGPNAEVTRRAAHFTEYRLWSKDAIMSVDDFAMITPLRLLGEPVERNGLTVSPTLRVLPVPQK